MAASHVVHLITGLDRGPARGRLDPLITALAARGVVSTIVTLVAPSPGAAAPAGARAVETLAMRADWPDPSGFLRLAALIRRLGPDILLTWDYQSALIGMVAHRLAGPDAPDLVWNIQDPPPARGALARILPGLLALFSDRPDAIVVKSREILRAHAPLGYHSRDWRQIPHALAEGTGSVDPGARAAWRARLRVGDDAILIGLVEGSDRLANLVRFLRAAKALARTDPAARFIVLGPRADVNDPVIRQALAEVPDIAVDFLVCDPIGDRVLDALDIFAAASAPHETLPDAAIEAMARGIPSVVASGGDAEGVVPDPRLMVPPRDSAALSGALRRLMRLPKDQRQAIADRGAITARERFGLAGVTEAYGRLVSDLTDHRALLRHMREQAAAEALRSPSRGFGDGLLARIGDMFGLKGRAAGRTLAGTVILVALMTAIGRSATFVREIMVAATFGTGPELEAYFLALAIPTFLTVSATAAIPAAYARIAREAGEGGTPDVLGRMTLLLGLAAFIVAALLILTAPAYMAILGNGLPPDTVSLAIGLVPWVTMIVPSQVWIALWTMALNVRGRFAWPALLSALTPFGVVVALVLARGHASADTLAHGTAAGAAVETLVIAGLSLGGGTWMRLRLDGLRRALRAMMREMGTVMLGTISLGLIPLADQIVSAQVGPGGVAAFVLGSKIVASITGISAIALSQAVLPRISHLIATGDRLALVALARNAIVLVIGLGLLASGLVAVFSEGIVDIVFARGRFGAAETAAVAAAQAAYAWQVAPFLAWIVISRILVTLGRSRTVLVLSAITALVNVALDLGVVGAFGVPGVALTTAVSFLFAMFAGYVALSGALDETA